MSQQKKVKELKKALGSRWRGEEGCEDLVFVTMMGSPVLRYHAEKEIKKVVKEINLLESVQAIREQREPVVFEDMYPHAIRHTFCSRCFEADMQSKVVQSIMGHQHYSTTIDIYTHVTDAKFEEEIGKFRLALEEESTEEVEDIKEQYARQQKVQYAKHQAEKYERLEKHALDAENKRQYGARKEEWRERSSNYGIDKVSNTTILNTENTTKEVVAVHSVGKINKNIYKYVMDDILTDEVIITDERIQHIKERHPNDYERFYSYIPEIVANPDYIIEANKPNTAAILKEIEDKGEKFKLVLRLKVKEGPVGYKNSVMTFWKIGDTTWKKV